MTHIEQLAATKPFGALTAAEKALVCAEMSESEYTALHEVLTMLPQLDAAVAPPAALQKRLMQHFKEVHPPQPWWVRVAQARVPLWQAAAAIAILLAAVVAAWPVPQPATLPASLAERTVYQRDTLWLHDTLWQERTIVRYQVAKEAPEPVADALMPVTRMQIDSTFPYFDVETSPVGTSLNDSPELMEFLSSGK